MRIAVREHEAANAAGVQRGEYLAHAAAAIVADQVHLFDFQCIQKLSQHVSICRHGNILRRRDFGIAVRQQIQRNAAPQIFELHELMSP